MLQQVSTLIKNLTDHLIRAHLIFFGSWSFSSHARTGSGSKNKCVMTHVIRRTFKWRGDDGVGWHSTISNNLRWARTTTWNRKSRRGRCIETRQRHDRRLECEEYLQEINHNNGLIIQKLQVDINEPVVDLPDVVYAHATIILTFSQFLDSRGNEYKYY